MPDSKGGAEDHLSGADKADDCPGSSGRSAMKSTEKLVKALMAITGQTDSSAMVSLTITAQAESSQTASIAVTGQAESSQIASTTVTRQTESSGVGATAQRGTKAYADTSGAEATISGRTGVDSEGSRTGAGSGVDSDCSRTGAGSGVDSDCSWSGL